MSRVYCLYRVSTTQQLKEDDIPMQRQACREFADMHNWTIIKELYEKGISGFKTPTRDRKILQQIKKDAEQGKFDILLVFMFDRLGRRENETPFFVEDLAYHGIEIWSVKEGRQKFETHADKLINFIHYWIAEGESEKTSERIRTRKAQLAQAGIYTGGACPYGYRLVYRGRRNSKGFEIHDLAINEQEASVIRKMFDLYIEYGYGPRRISSALAEEDILDRRGEPFHYSSVSSMLHRELFMGVIRSGSVCSNIIPELQIITPEVFDRAQQIRALRKKNQLPRTMGHALMSGNLYCGCCGGRMFASTAKRTHHPDYTEKISVYKCYNRVQYKSRCTAQATYRSELVDNAILEQLGLICEEKPEYRSIYKKFNSAEFPAQKMILGQWIKATLFSYDKIELIFSELE